MSLRRSLSTFLLCLATTAAALAPTGCGDDDSSAKEQNAEEAPAVPSKAYGDVLTGLRKAALAGDTYGALRRADPLEAPEEATVDAFCETAWQLEINEETEQLAKRSYVVGRIRSLAELNMGVAYVPGRAKEPALTAAMKELQEVIDLASLDAKSNSRYKRACYR